MMGTMRIIILSNNANCLISVRQEGPQDHPACGVLHSTTQYYTVRMLCKTVESPF